LKKWATRLDFQTEEALMAYFITRDCIGCTLCARICPTEAIRGEKKQRHCIDAALCIECGACGRICPRQAVRDPFGRMVKREKKKDWKKPVFNLDACMACGMCVDACPAGCLELGAPSGKDKNAYPVLADSEACLGCGFCVDECPVDAVVLAPPGT
jgi:formate hydrogenlyase subunit 6/NADH:ubiquinone oxidoreductase subunit I